MSQKEEKQTFQILVFRLGEHLFAFKMLDLRVVSRLLDTTPVARAANFFKGLVNLRGSLSPVIDLRALFLLPEKEADSQTRLLSVWGGGSYLSFIVDSIYKVISVSSEQLEPPPGILFDEFIETVYKQNEKLILILNSKKLVSQDEIKTIIEARGKPSLLLPEDTNSPL